MIGAIIGDIVGSRFEFNNAKGGNFALFTKQCDFTDDTICTVAVADAILKGEDYKSSILRWCRKYPNPVLLLVGLLLPTPSRITASAMAQRCV